MNKDKTDITVILDRSGSMQSMKVEAEGGLNEFVRKQTELPGEAVYTLCQFDTEYEFVHRAIPVADVPKFLLVPRGMTALLDAVGRCIVETGERLSQISEEDRPGLVVFVIVSDGMENSSREYTKQKVLQMIEHQQKSYGWQFTFLGANQDAFAEAGGLGVVRGDALQYETKTAGFAFTAASDKLGRMREQAGAGKAVKSDYTEEERAAATGSKK